SLHILPPPTPTTHPTSLHTTMLRSLTKVMAAAGATTTGWYILTSRSMASATGNGSDGVPPPPAVRPLVLSGPSGVGKSSMIKRILAENPGCFGFSVSHTTRKPRAGEVDGVDYHYISKDQMVADVARGLFIESATFSANMYGTSFAAVQSVAEKGKICILDVELQGVLAIRDSNLDARIVVVFPPSMEDLETRLRSRGTETEDAIQLRLTAAKADMAYIREHNIADVIIVNDNLDVAINELMEVVQEDLMAVKTYHADLKALGLPVPE
ncbi:guanylate kinase 1 isoform a, partial [Thecamonas trahens ATCC 50062]